MRMSRIAICLVALAGKLTLIQRARAAGSIVQVFAADPLTPCDHYFFFEFYFSPHCFLGESQQADSIAVCMHT